MCCLLMVKLITVPVYYDSCIAFYISPCSCLHGLVAMYIAIYCPIILQ